jgi:hypothetical protein
VTRCKCVGGIYQLRCQKQEGHDGPHYANAAGKGSTWQSLAGNDKAKEHEDV